jgi:beta-galactosidase
LETTECPGDDKTYTTGACPGSYESPNGSSGKLHLAWTVPFAPGKVVAVARDATGKVVARDEVDTAGAPDALKLTPDKTVLRADGKALSYVTVHVVDEHGIEVPDADNTIHVSVRGPGSFAGADNGKQDDAEGYKSPTHDAFNGKLLAIVQAGTRPGPITITASADGLHGAAITLRASDRPRGDGPRADSVRLSRSHRAFGPRVASTAPAADASFSGGVFSDGGSDFGTSSTLPTAMLDGNPATFWSNRYSKGATQTLPEITNSHPSDWVSVSWGAPQRVDQIQALFVVDANDQLPTTITVSYWDGSSWKPVSDQSIAFAGSSGAPSSITFDPVATTKLKLDMTSASPGDPMTGNLAIAELRIPGVT